MISLRPITADTVGDVCQLSLSLKPPQNRAVAHNAFSIAQAHFSDTAWFRAIYDDDTPVGFLMLDDQPGKLEYFLWRLMIAAEHQGKGYGKAAVDRLVEYVKTRPGADQLLVSCIEGEGSPLGFYESIGFIKTGRKHGDEIELALDLRASDPGYTPIPADTPHDTEGRIREYFDRLINRRDLSVCEERLSLDYVDHDARAGTPPGPQATIDYMANRFTEHPDFAVRIDDLLLAGRKAALRLTYTGLNTDPPEMTGIVILHLDQTDRFLERWSAYD